VHQQQQKKELLACRSERDSAREDAATALKDAACLRALLQAAQLRQIERDRETASKEIVSNTFEAERVKMHSDLSEKVILSHS
jgi:hypothetical protein